MQKGIDYPGICVTYMCHDGAGRLLFQKRSAQCRDEHGCWDTGGGGLDLGDTIEGTLRKEIREEYDADVLEFEFLGYRDVHRDHQGTPTHWLALDFKVRVDPAHVRNAEPHKFSEIGWFTIDDTPTPLHSQLPMALDRYRSKLLPCTNKEIKFAPHLVTLLRAGTKTTTWRLFDDKDLTAGDMVTLVDKMSLRQVGTARIASINLKRLRDITAQELAEHDYADHRAMYANLNEYYGDRATPDTEVKMITFECISCTPVDS